MRSLPRAPWHRKVQLSLVILIDQALQSDGKAMTSKYRVRRAWLAGMDGNAQTSIKSFCFVIYSVASHEEHSLGCIHIHGASIQLLYMKSTRSVVFTLTALVT